MSNSGKIPPDANVEPTREVLRRLYLCGGVVSLRSGDSLLARARELAAQAWLVEVSSYPHFGTTYVRFRAGDKLDLKMLSEL